MKKKIIIILIIFVSVPLVVYFFFPGVLYDFSMKRYREAAGLLEDKVKVDRNEIFYLHGGSGDTVLLLHGFGANKDNWPLFAAYLTKNYRVIVPDLPGFGKSSKFNNEKYTVPEQVKRLDKFTKALGLEKFHIAGNSMGGSIAGKFAIEYPERVISLGLFAPGSVTSAEKSEHAKLVEQGTNVLLVKTPDDYRRFLSFVFVKPPPIPGSIIRYLTKKNMENREFNNKIYQEFKAEGFSLDKEAHRIKIPSLILWGDRDRVLHVSGAGILAGIIPRNRKVIMKACGHVPMIERPGETARYYLEFLKLVEQGAL